MKRLILSFLLMYAFSADAQSLSSQFKLAFEKMLDASEYQHATIGILVLNTATGTIFYEHNSQTGLAPASTQKVITAATALELLERDFQYHTPVSYTGTIQNGILNGNIIIKGNGDPTLGSWRYEETKEDKILKGIADAVSREGINEIKGHVLVNESGWQSEITPPGWIWQDIGNYYGAGARALNWRENQYDLYLHSRSRLNSAVNILGTLPTYIADLHLESRVTAAAAGSGDNAYIYLPLGFGHGWVRGTIPVNQKRFSISGSMPNPPKQLALNVEAALKKQLPNAVAKDYLQEYYTEDTGTPFYTITSPSLDRIVYWFLHKSINLYGEALLKTLGQVKGAGGSTEAGLEVVHDFWGKHGLDEYTLGMQDGSGLSPGNRITPASLVKVLRYARTRPWFKAFHEAIPEIHGIKMKSGTINGVVAYTGYVGGSSDEKYTFAFIINNYDGSAGAARRDMWNLLDLLK